jgi:hypothetical protein
VQHARQQPQRYYSVTLLAMLFLQRHHEARWRDVGDFLEELTTTWYFGAAMISETTAGPASITSPARASSRLLCSTRDSNHSAIMWLLSRVLHNNLLLALAGLVILAGPAVVSLLAKDSVGKFVAATGHSGHHRLSGVCDVPKKDCVIFYLSPAARPPPGNYAIFLRNIAYAAEPVVAAMTSSGHKLPHTISRLASFGYVSPVENMPQWLQDLTWINPIRHFTDITKQIYLWWPL